MIKIKVTTRKKKCIIAFGEFRTILPRSILLRNFTMIDGVSAYQSSSRKSE